MSFQIRLTVHVAEFYLILERLKMCFSQKLAGQNTLSVVTIQSCTMASRANTSTVETSGVAAVHLRNQRLTHCCWVTDVGDD